MLKGGLAGLMKQAQQMQENMKKAQADLAQTEVVGQTASGAVKVTMTCDHDVKRVALEDAVLEDREMLEDLLVVALKDAHRQAESATEQRMSGFSQGLPPGFKLPF